MGRVPTNASDPCEILTDIDFVLLLFGRGLPVVHFEEFDERPHVLDLSVNDSFEESY